MIDSLIQLIRTAVRFRNMPFLRNILRSIYYPLKRMVDYNGYKQFKRESKIQVYNTKDTIQHILENHVSVSRFGDGEYKVMNSKGNGFQQSNQELGERLKEVLNSNVTNHIVS